jgi:hypothetical protein
VVYIVGKDSESEGVLTSIPTVHQKEAVLNRFLVIGNRIVPIFQVKNTIKLDALHAYTIHYTLI